MEIKTLWKIILKSIGLWLLINCIYVLPQFASTFSFTNEFINWDSLIFTWIITLSVLIIYILITRVFLFKTDWLINILKLDKNFTQEKIDVNIPSEKLLSIVVIVIGGIIFIQSLPSLCQGIFEFLKQKELIRNYPETSWMILYFIKTLFGYLIMTNSKVVVRLINKKSSED